MGGKQSTDNGSGGNGGSSGGELIEKLNNYSGNYGSTDPNRVTYTGMSKYLNQEAGKSLDTRVGSNSVERAIHYSSIQSLAEKIGMDDNPKYKLLNDSYNTLNTQKRYLEEAHIDRPGQPGSKTQSTGANNREALPEHPKELHKAAVELAVNPHSYTSLSGMKAQDLLKLDTSTLHKVVHADTEFVEKTKDAWNLPQDERGKTAVHVGSNYNGDLCHSLGLAGQTNATPTEAFVKGKDALLNAVNQGFDVYSQHTGHAPDSKILKAFGDVAMNVNLAKDPAQTLTGRGADTISENTMAFSSDGHNLGGRKF